MGLRRRCLTALAIVIASVTGRETSVGAAPDRLTGVPRVVLWAWERPEDLRGVDRRVGVAYLAATFRLSGARSEVAMRAQPLKVDPATRLVAVVRIETSLVDRPTLDARRIAELSARIAALRGLDGVRAIQVDFDARTSERAFYRELLTEIRRHLGVFPLSMTALASWCASDHWIDGLPVDEAVPMLFRMGPEHEPFLEAGSAGRFTAPLCAGAVGVSTDERTPALRGHRRAYIFHPRSWTLREVGAAVNEVTRWQ
jgi:hypothetical protein